MMGGSALGGVSGRGNSRGPEAGVVFVWPRLSAEPGMGTCLSDSTTIALPLLCVPVAQRKLFFFRRKGPGHRQSPI